MIFIAWDMKRSEPKVGPDTLKVARLATGERALRGEPWKVELAITNLGPAIKTMVVRDFPPSQAKVTRGSTAMVCALETGASAKLRYEVTFDEPGEFAFNESVATAASSFGLWEKSTVLNSPLKVRVYPRRSTRQAQAARARAFAWTGTTASKYRGGRVEFMDIRAYARGDPLKSVNWKASARNGKTLVNEWRADRGLDCVIIVDLSPRNLPKVGDWSARTQVIAASYELAGSLLDSGNRVGMLIMGDVLHKIKPGFGSRHLRKMVEYLVASREGEVWSLGHVQPFLELFFRRQYSTRGGTLFFVMAGPDELALDTVESMSRRGFVCNSILVNTLEEEKAGLMETRFLDRTRVEFGERMAGVEMEAYKVAFAGVSNVYEWTEANGFNEVGRMVQQ